MPKPVFESTLGRSPLDSSRTMYEAAQRRFVIRDFDGTAAILVSLRSSPEFDMLRDTWRLWLTLTEAAFSDKHWGRSVARSDVRRLVRTGGLLEELAAAFTGYNVGLILDIWQRAMNLQISYCQEPLRTIGSVETLLSELPPIAELSIAARNLYGQIVFRLAVDLLASREVQDFDYARALVEPVKFDPELATKLCETLNDLERTRSVGFADENINEDDDTRVEAAIESSQILSSPPKKENAEAAPVAAVKEQLKPTLDLDVTRSEISRPTASRRHLRANLVQGWKLWINQMIRRRGLYNTLVLVALLLSLVSNAGVQYVVSAGSAWLWTALRTSIKMGMTVTYL